MRLLTRVGAAGRSHPFLVAVAVLSVVYVGLSLSPSSYALALEAFGVQDTGLLLGHPQQWRWDEWAVLTPYTQATLNTGHATVNTTSFYGESLQNLMALPVADWGLLIRPTMWGFFVLPPAYAFSLQWTLLLAAALSGWYLLLVQLRFGRLAATLGTLALVFSGFFQTWWTAIAGSVAVFPWLLLLLLARRPRWWVRLPLIAWLAAVWVGINLYPPAMIALAWVALFVVVAFRPRILRSGAFWVRVASTITGAALGLVYFLPILEEMRNTYYPGSRRVVGGDVDPAQWLGQVLPFFPTSGDLPRLPATNISEVSTVGTYLFLAALLFVDWVAVLRRWPWRFRPGSAAWRIGVLSIGFGLASVWSLTTWLAPVGRFLLWDYVPGRRMLLASGLLLFLLSMVLVTRLPLRFGFVRTGVFIAVVLGAWWWSTRKLLGDGAVPGSDWEDLVGAVAVGFFALWVLDRERRGEPVLRRHLLAGLIGTAAVANVVGWGLFNPVQRSGPIFTKPDTEITRSLDALAAQRPDGAIAVNPYQGATLNGIGYRSVVHVLTTPEVEVFRRIYPDLPEDQLQFLFNRYLSIALVPSIDTPKLDGPGVVHLPTESLRPFATIG